MKFIAALATLLFILPAVAQESKDTPMTPDIVGNTPAEFGYLLNCTAAQIALMHLHTQVAASLTALSSSHPPQLALLADSYRTMAKADQTQIKLYFDAIKTAVVPQITASGKVKPDEVMHKANDLMNDSLAQIMDQIGDSGATYEEEIGLEQLLVEQSRGCETLANKVLEHHTI